MPGEPEYVPPPPRTVPASLPASLRPGYLDVMVQMGFMTVPGVKKRGRVGDVEREPYDQIIAAARLLPRAGDPMYNDTLIFLVGPLAAWGPPLRDAAAGEAVAEDFPIPNKETHEKIFKNMLKHLHEQAPLLKHLYLCSIHDPKPWEELTKRMSTAAEDARTTDTRVLKTNTASLVAPTEQHILFPALSTGSKSDRGFAHETLRLFLLPPKDRRYLPEPLFAKPKADHPNQLEMPDQSAVVLCEKGLEILAKLNDGTYVLKTKSFPSFLYPDGAYIQGKPTENLFRGYIFIRGLRLIWLGPAYMLHGLRGKLPDARSAARKANVWSVSPEMVGYLACQLHVMLTSNDWSATKPKTAARQSNTTAKPFDYGDFFKRVVELFNDPARAKWAEETLDFLKEAVFGDAVDPHLAPPDEDDSDDEFASERTAIVSELEANAAAAAAAAVAAVGGPVVVAAAAAS